jgi:hypothetical protein
MSYYRDMDAKSKSRFEAEFNSIISNAPPKQWNPRVKEICIAFDVMLDESVLNLVHLKGTHITMAWINDVNECLLAGHLRRGCTLDPPRRNPPRKARVDPSKWTISAADLNDEESDSDFSPSDTSDSEMQTS